MNNKLTSIVLAGVMFVGAILLAGCSDSEEPKAKRPTTLAVPANMTGKPEAIALVKNNWAKMLRACPGLVEYQKDFTFLELHDMSGSSFPEMARVDVIFKVRNDLGRIPNSWQAYGHNCQYGIGADGKTLRIKKAGCVSLCLDREYLGPLDYVAPL